MHEEKCMANTHPHTNNPNFEIFICIIGFNQVIALLNIKAVNDRVEKLASYIFRLQCAAEH